MWFRFIVILLYTFSVWWRTTSMLYSIEMQSFISL